MNCVTNLPAIIPVSELQNAIALAPTPNERVRKYVEEFTFRANKSAELTIKLALTILDAEKALKKDEFREFCSTVGLGPQSLKKYRGIGHNALKLQECLPNLPHCWTTQYWLTTLEKAAFTHLKSSGLLTPGVSRRQLEEHLASFDPPTSEKKTPAASSPRVQSRSILAVPKRVSAAEHATEQGPEDLKARLLEEVCFLVDTYEPLRETDADIFGKLFDLKRALQPEDEDEDECSDDNATYPAVSRSLHRGAAANRVY